MTNREYRISQATKLDNGVVITLKTDDQASIPLRFDPASIRKRKIWKRRQLPKV
jgi:hypothetical protein